MSAKIPKFKVKGLGTFTPPPKPEPAISIPNVTLPESVFLDPKKYADVTTREDKEQPPEK